MKRSVSEKLKKIQAALKPLEIPGKPADAPVKPAHLAKLLDVAPSSLSRWMRDKVVPRGRQKERLDILYRTVLEAERNEDAKKILKKLVSPMPAIGLMAGTTLSPIGLGLFGAIAAAGLGWLLSDKEDAEAESDTQPSGEGSTPPVAPQSDTRDSLLTRAKERGIKKVRRLL